MDRPARDVIRPGPDDIEWMTALLTQAFLVEAPTTHLFLGPHRERQVRYFMRCSVAYAAHFGECHATAERRGVALWLLPGATAMTPARMRVAGMFSAPWRMGPRAFLRFMGFAAHTDRLHRAAARCRRSVCAANPMKRRNARGPIRHGAENMPATRIRAGVMAVAPGSSHSATPRRSAVAWHSPKCAAYATLQRMK